jgi:hypothetical protein
LALQPENRTDKGPSQEDVKLVSLAMRITSSRRYLTAALLRVKPRRVSIGRDPPREDVKLVLLAIRITSPTAALQRLKLKRTSIGQDPPRADVKLV